MSTAGITFVVLASLPKADLSRLLDNTYVWPASVDKADFLKALAKLKEQYPERTTVEFSRDVDTVAGINVFVVEHSDGGNGGGGGYSGGEKPKYAMANSGLAIWRFPTIPADRLGSDRSIKFPPLVRFELAIHFSNHNHLTTYLDAPDYGVLLSKIFDSVQVISVHNAVAAAGT